MKTILSIEESARLVDLGVDAKLASHKEFVDIHPEVLKGNAEYARPWGWFPCFSLTDILSILPKEIKFGLWCNLKIQHIYEEWAVNYSPYPMAIIRAPELIDALNSLLIWAITNGHVKTEKK